MEESLTGRDGKWCVVGELTLTLPPSPTAAPVDAAAISAVAAAVNAAKPGFKRSITYSCQEDGGFEDKFAYHAHRHEFADLTWYPSQRQVVYRHDDRVPLNTSGDGMNDFLGFQSTPILSSAGVRAAEKGFEELKSAKGKCAMVATEMAYKKLISNGLKNSFGLFTGYPVIGHQGKMQTSGSCLHSHASDILSMCAWDPRIKGLFFYETTAIFSPSNFRDFIRDVKKLRDLNTENFCGVDVYNGFLIRFIKGSSAYLGQPEDSVVVDFNYYRANDPSTPRLNQDLWEEVEQMAFFKYGARPHWGKNRRVAFLGAQHKYPNMSKFIAAVKQLDPHGMFYSPWSEELISGENRSRGEDGCALEGQCICSKDSHCSPDNGYLCKVGLVYQQAKVCRYTA